MGKELLESAMEPDFLEYVRWIRLQIHEYSELGFKEHRTSQLIRSELDSLGINYVWHAAKTRVVASIGSGDSPVFALHADMDALPTQVRVTIVLGSAAPPLSVKLMQVFSSGSKDASIVDQELKVDSENGIHILEALPESVDVGKFTFVFEKTYATGGRTKVPIFVTGVMKVDNAKIALLDSDLGSVETQKR